MCTLQIRAGMTDPARTVRHVLTEAAAAASMAPSSHNTQPWRFRIIGDRLLILADHDRHLKVIDRERRQLLMSCGCALFNARVAVRAFGYEDRVTLAEEGVGADNIVATLELGDHIVSTEADLALNRAVPVRRTNRRPFKSRPVGTNEFEALEQTAALNGAWMVRLDPEQKKELAGVIDAADRLQYGDPEFRHELGHWLAPVMSRRRDGIPFVEKEYGSSMPFGVMRAVRSAGLGDELGEIEKELVTGAPVVAVLGTDGDGPVDWLACGQALEAVLLHATTLTMSASFLNQVLELAESRANVSYLLHHPGFPQMVLRIGYADEEVKHPAPRRELDDMLRVIE